MSRLCPTLVLGCGLVLASCTGQNTEGRWAGPWPYEDAQDCRTQLFPNGNFELVCKDNTWVGVGRYSRNSDVLRFEFQALTHRGEALKNPQPMEVRITQAGGNEMSLLAIGPDEPLKWSRRMPAADQR